MKKTVVVGMSGGVDSSVSALLLKQQGFKVIGMFMKNWEEGEECPAEKDYQDVARVCDLLDIPYYSVNFSQDYWDGVFTSFLADCKRGITPNPDVLCNREIKFKILLEKALELGGDYLATGHYCQIGEGPTLLRGKDSGKDQSYFLCSIAPKALLATLFPIGGMEKSSVRKLARKHNLATSEKKDSTGICFIGKRNFRQFLSKYIPARPGPFQTPEGKYVGEHIGLPFYTIGQRKGLAIGGAGQAWFVADKDVEKNVVTVVQGGSHPALFKTTLIADELNWISPEPPFPFKCTAKVRYRQKDAPCTLEKIAGEKVLVTFDAPQKAVTPGQYIVFYSDDVCLGGGRIC